MLYHTKIIFIKILIFFKNVTLIIILNCFKNYLLGWVSCKWWKKLVHSWCHLGWVRALPINLSHSCCWRVVFIGCKCSVICWIMLGIINSWSPADSIWTGSVWWCSSSWSHFYLFRYSFIPECSWLKSLSRILFDSVGCNMCIWSTPWSLPVFKIGTLRWSGTDSVGFLVLS